MKRETIAEIDEARENKEKEDFKKTEKNDLKKIEAILFISGRFLGMKELMALSDLNPVIIREIIKKLKDEYQQRDSAIQITEKNEMWKMDVRPEYSSIINKLATGSSEFSRAEQETLAIIAFKQPIKQSVIVKIRGNKAYEHIKKFADLNLLRKKKTGHTYELSLSDDFYDYFNISEGGIKEK
jgi:segregation and condensation protein B